MERENYVEIIFLSFFFFLKKRCALFNFRDISFELLVKLYFYLFFFFKEKMEPLIF